MSRSTSSGKYLSVSGTPFSSGVTIAAWLYQSSLATASGTVAGAGKTIAGNYFGLGYNWNGSIGRFSAFSDPGTGEVDGFSTLTMAANTWYHSEAVWNGTTEKAYTNGANVGSANNTISSSVNVFHIGALDVSGSVVSTVTGLIAEVAAWTTALTAAEVLALAAGCPPWTVRPASLWAYWPLYGLQSPEPDLSGNARSLTLTGAPPAANHAPVWPAIFGSTNPLFPAPASRLVPANASAYPGFWSHYRANPFDLLPQSF